MKKRILLVEDNEVNLELMLAILEDDFDVLEARDGEQGFDIAVREKPDLILMDLSLPKLDGWELTRRLRDREDMVETPIIAVTAHAVKGDYERAMEAGCDGYLTKPVDDDTLLAEIAAFLERGRAAGRE